MGREYRLSEELSEHEPANHNRLALELSASAITILNGYHFIAVYSKSKGNVRLAVN